MRSLGWTVLVAAVVALTVPADLWAQGRGRGQQKQKEKNVKQVRLDRDSERVFHDAIVLRDRNGRIIVVDRDDIEGRFVVNQRQGRGPAFCRSGAGHPVWGRQWCLEKGWGLGGRTVFLDGGNRVIFRSGDQFVVARVRDDRGTIERIVDRILFWTD